MWGLKIIGDNLFIYLSCMDAGCDKLRVSYGLVLSFFHAVK
jgi:hypothetical protein